MEEAKNKLERREIIMSVVISVAIFNTWPEDGIIRDICISLSLYTEESLYTFILHSKRGLDLYICPVTTPRSMLYFAINTQDPHSRRIISAFHLTRSYIFSPLLYSCCL